MDEEKRRLQSTREEVGDSSGGRRIDFEAGKVTISRRGTAVPAAEETESDEATLELAGADPAEAAVEAQHAAPEGGETGETADRDEAADRGETVNSAAEGSAEQR